MSLIEVFLFFFVCLFIHFFFFFVFFFGGGGGGGRLWSYVHHIVDVKICSDVVRPSGVLLFFSVTRVVLCC